MEIRSKSRQRMKSTEVKGDKSPENRSGSQLSIYDQSNYERNPPTKNTTEYLCFEMAFCKKERKTPHVSICAQATEFICSWLRWLVNQLCTHTHTHKQIPIRRCVNDRNQSHSNRKGIVKKLNFFLR